MLKMQRRSQKSLSEDKTYIPFSSQCQTVDVFSSETVHQVTQLTRKTVNWTVHVLAAICLILVQMAWLHICLIVYSLWSISAAVLPFPSCPPLTTLYLSSACRIAPDTFWVKFRQKSTVCARCSFTCCGNLSSQPTYWPVLRGNWRTQKKATHSGSRGTLNLMLPLPCFIVGLVFSGWWAMLAKVTFEWLWLRW